MSNWKKLNFSQYDSKEPHSSLEVDFTKYQSTEVKHKLIGSKYKPLRHSEQIKHINEFLEINSKHGFDLDKMKFPPKETAFINQLKILILKMKAFQYFVKRKLVHPEEDLGEILLGTLKEGFKFNSSYKKRLEEYTRSYLRGERDTVYQEFPDYHLIPWLDEDDIENIYVFSDPLPIKEKKLNKVMDRMDDHIVDDALIRDIDLIDALYLINNKKVNHLDKKGRTMTAFDYRGGDLDISFPTDGLDYLFKKVTTDPSTSRAAGLPTVRTRNLVYAAHSNLDLVTLHPNDLYKEGLEPSVWIERMSVEKNRHYIMIDFKKSGLTTNRDVIKAVYKVAVRHYKRFRPWLAYLDSLGLIRVNGTISKRGTSLGMDDNALSFFLSCAFEEWKENHYLGSKVVGFFKGDDQILICDCFEEEAKEIFRSWLKDLRDLGLLVNAKKSFIGQRGQFCEIVGRGSGIDNKIIGYSLNCFDALGTYNHIDFKMYINNLKKNHDLQTYALIFDYCLVSTIFSVKPEFCDSEIIVPFEMGGYFSNYERKLNTFIVDVYDNKITNCDRRLFNLIGCKLPKVSWRYRKMEEFYSTVFRDTQTMLDKIKKISAQPMTAEWKKCYDICAQERQNLFHGPITLIGSRIQMLLDEKESFALPIDLLFRKENKERTYVPMKKFKGKIRLKMTEHFKLVRKDMIVKQEKKYYFIDEIRARELLLSARDGNNIFLINYYCELPMSTVIWSLCKFITNSDWAIPIDWVEYVYRTKVSLDKLWRYYGSKGIHLYDYRPRLPEEQVVTALFRGPDNINTDSVIMCPYSGFPLKFSSWEYRAWVENHHGHTSKDKKFFLDLSDHYYREWSDEVHERAWYGPLGRNRPAKKEWLVKKAKEQAQIYSIADYMQKVVLPRREQQSLIVTGVSDHEEVEEEEKLPDLNSDEDVKVKSKEESDEENYSDSDMLEDYLRDNPLNKDTDDEEDPYRDLSESDSEG